MALSKWYCNRLIYKNVGQMVYLELFNEVHTGFSGNSSSLFEHHGCEKNKFVRHFSISYFGLCKQGIHNICCVTINKILRRCFCCTNTHKAKRGPLQVDRKMETVMMIDNLMKEVERYKEKFTNDFFDELRDRIIKETGIKSDIVLGSWISMAFYETGNVEGGRCLMEYIQQKQGSLSSVQKLNYLKILSKTNLDHRNDEFIYTLYEELKEVILDEEGMRMVSDALLSTKNWKESKDYFKRMSNRISDAKFNILKGILITSIEKGDLDVYSSMIPWLSKFGLGKPFVDTTQEIYQVFFDVQKRGGNASIIPLLETFCKNDLVAGESTILMLKDHLNKFQNWNATLAKVDIRTGICRHCGEKLPSGSGLTTNEFRQLKDEFPKYSVNSVQFSSTDEEIQKFNEFLQKNGPFDLVIDSLNLLLNENHIHFGTSEDFIFLPEDKSKHIGMDFRKRNVSNRRNDNYRMFLAAVQKFAQEGHRILVIGRKHAEKNLLISGATVFCVGQRSKDDFFMIMAALQSGPHCMIMSSDFLSNSRYLLPTPTSNYFLRWQAERQIGFSIHYGSNRSKITFFLPSKLPTRAHSYSEGWHIPYYKDGDEFIRKPPFIKTDNFLCVKY